jgi:hypothetical protein
MATGESKDEDSERRSNPFVLSPSTPLGTGLSNHIGLEHPHFGMASSVFTSGL